MTCFILLGDKKYEVVFGDREIRLTEFSTARAWRKSEADCKWHEERATVTL